MQKRVMFIAFLLLAICNKIVADDQLTASDVSMYPGDSKEVSVALTNEETYVGFQFDLYLPDGLTVESFSGNSNRLPEGTTPQMAQQSDGSYRFIAAALGGNPIAGNDGPVLTLTLKSAESIAVNDYTAYLRNVKISKADGSGVIVAEQPFTVTIAERPKVADVQFAQEGNVVALSTTTANAKIFYTLSNNDNGEQEYTAPLTMTSDCTIEAWATRDDYLPSDTTSFVFHAGGVTCSNPVFARNENVITISTLTDGASIYYTTDGTDPTEQSMLYSEPIAVDHNMTIKAIAMRQNYYSSQIETFMVDWFKCEKPEMAWIDDQMIATTTTDGAIIQYTLTQPGVETPLDQGGEASPLKITVTQDVTITLYAVKTGWANSDTLVVDYPYTAWQGLVVAIDSAMSVSSQAANNDNVPAEKLDSLHLLISAAQASYAARTNSLLAIQQQTYELMALTDAIRQLVNAVNEPYAVLSDNNTVLTFYYDKMKKERGGISIQSANSITVTFSDFEMENASQPETLTLSDGTTLTFNIGDNGINPPAYYMNGATLRMYRHNTMTVDAGSRIIVGIEIVCSKYNETVYNASGNVAVDGTKMIVNDSILEFSGPNANTATVANVSEETGATGQLRMTVLKIYYADSQAPALQMANKKNRSSVVPNHTADITTVVFDESFANCTTLKSTASWFSGCSNLTTIEGIKNLKTNNATDMSYMFGGCSGLSSLDLSNFTTANMTNVRGTFMSCSNLTTIYVGSGWSMGKIELSSDMFTGCTSLVGGMGTSYDANHVDYTYAHIDGGTANPGYFTPKNGYGQAAIPTFTHEGNLVFINSATEGATIRYTIDGEAPTDTTGIVYSDSIRVTRNCTVRAIAIRENFTPSEVAEYNVDWFKCEMPTIISWSGDTLRAVSATEDAIVNCILRFTSDGPVAQWSGGPDPQLTLPIQNDLYVELFATKEGWMTSDTLKFYYPYTAWHQLTDAINDANTVLAAAANNDNVTDADRNALGSLIEAAQQSYAARTETESAVKARTDELVAQTAIVRQLVEAVNEPYAVLSENNTVLTFYYDKKKEERGGMDVVPFNDINQRGWHEQRENITRVVFDDSFADCDTLTSTASWFAECGNLTTIENLNLLKTANVTNMSSMFWSCSSLTNLDLSNLNTANVTNMHDMFYGCSSLTSLDLSNFNTSNVTIMDGLFAYCSYLSSVDVSSFNTTNVTNMMSMFYFCSSLTNLDVSNFNTANVTEMSSMFADCHSLTSLDVSNFKTDNVTDIRWMFKGSSGLKTIYVGSGWSTEAVKEGGDMFAYCTSLVGGQGTTYDADHTDYTYAHIDEGASNPGYFTDKNAPVMIPSPIITIDGNILSITTNFAGASIHYTLDGSKPTKESTSYVAPITLTQNCCVRAIATMEGLDDSEESIREVGGLTRTQAVPAPVIAHQENIFTMFVPSVNEDGTDVTDKVAVEPALWGAATPEVNLSGEWTCKVLDNSNNVTETFGVTLYNGGKAVFPSPCLDESSWSYKDGKLYMRHDKLYTNDNWYNYQYATYNLTTTTPENPIEFTGTRENVVGNSITENVSSANVIFTYNGNSLAGEIVATNDNREAVVTIVDEGSSEKTGELLQQSVTGLENGYYTVELYAKSVYSSASSMAADVTYLFANDTKLFIPVEADKDIHEHNVYQIGVEVMDGTLRLGLGKDKTGANWHALQIKSLTRHTLNTAQPIENATIYYTTDNSTPTTTSTQYTSPFEITKNCTVKAIAVAQGYSVSDVASYRVDWNATFDSSTGVLAINGSTTLTEALESVGGLEEVAKRITTIVWNRNVALTNSDLQGLDNPNMLVYVQSASQAPANRDNVVIGNDSTGYMAKNIKLTDVTEGNGDFYCPIAFTAEMITYTHEYSQQTEVGVSRGWETIALPFTVQTITHKDQGLITPFAADTINKHFWLRQLTELGLAQATVIEANTPYLISMPNSDAYTAEFNLNGRVTFSSQNVEVPQTQTNVVETHDINNNMVMFVPCFQSQAAEAQVYALNVGEQYNSYAEGSVFVANYRNIRPFEAFTVHHGNGPAPQFIPVSDMNGGLTGIEEVRCKMADGRSGVWYDLNGRQLQQKPTKGGVYILNGKKVVLR